MNAAATHTHGAHTVTNMSWPHSPIALADALRRCGYAERMLLLHSSGRHRRWGRYSSIAIAPVRTLWVTNHNRSWQARIYDELTGSILHDSEDIIETFDNLLTDDITPGRPVQPTTPRGGFVGGWGGYLSYDLAGLIEPSVPLTTSQDIHLPQAYMGLYDIVLRFDHLHNQWTLWTWELDLAMHNDTVEPARHGRLTPVRVPGASAGKSTGPSAPDCMAPLRGFPRHLRSRLGPAWPVHVRDDRLANMQISSTAYTRSHAASRLGLPGSASTRDTDLQQSGFTARQRAQTLVERLESALAGGHTAAPESHDHDNGTIVLHNATWNMTHAQYLQMVQQGLDYITAGDIFQVNLSQRYTIDTPADPWTIYTRLVRSNPASLGAFIDLGDQAVMSVSPELFLDIRGQQVRTCPIKGTAPRGHTPREDRRLRRQLQQSAKDAAELHMIIDLERNDLGRICRPGSIAVRKRITEQHPTVHHLVGCVEGQLLRSPWAGGFADCIRATFPGGSITGAPKVRAMQIIDKLEPTARSLYTGSIGYIGFDHHSLWNIAIRTMLYDRQRVHIQCGGGIVADSLPHMEYDETLHKARGMLRAMGVDSHTIAQAT